MSTSRTKWAAGKSPRRDGTALGFGIAFILFGVLGLLHAAGCVVKPCSVSAILFLGIGVAGIVSLLLRERR